MIPRQSKDLADKYCANSNASRLLPRCATQEEVDCDYTGALHMLGSRVWRLVVRQFGSAAAVCVHSSYAPRPKAAVLMLRASEMPVKASQ